MSKNSKNKMKNMKISYPYLKKYSKNKYCQYILNLHCKCMVNDWQNFREISKSPYIHYVSPHIKP